MGRRKKEIAAEGQSSLSFSRARWKHWLRYFGVTVIVLLNISLVMSTIQLHGARTAPDIGSEIFSFALVIFFDITVLLPTILEVDQVQATPNWLIFKTLFWTSRIPWGEILALHNPLYLTFVIVRTPRCFYLLNRRDLQPFDQLLETIEFKRGKAGE